MAIFRCKMCGGNLEVVEGASFCTCDSCGTQQTIPTVHNEGLQTLFNRANVLRMKSEFDKAAEIYEKIIQTSESEAEAYWGLILCKYGIEYIEDPKTYKRVPTCHRASYDAVTADEDYKSAIKYADAAQRNIYESESAVIDEIQRGIIALAQKEDPYDVFICYKETDESGKRTQDSVIANDIYYQLTQEGFKVFYAAITLEDKLGKEYEPYIFSALNTAKVMITLGTKPEYFNAVWVKNEWSRFLKIMKKDRSKLLIPCYRDMDAYELPEEFAHLQAQDMSKIGFINDLVRGIKKVIGGEVSQRNVQENVAERQSASGTTTNAQLKRGNIALEDHEWEKADSFFEEALNIEPECAEAYLGKLMCEKHQVSWNSWLNVLENQYEEPSTERLEACPADKEHIEQRVKEYSIEGYLDGNTIRKQYEYNRRYDSKLACRKAQKEKQLKELGEERLLARAKQYAKGEYKKKLDEDMARITAVLDRRIADAQEEDRQRIESVKESYDAYLSEADTKVEKLHADAINRCEQCYQQAVKAMNDAQAGTINETQKSIVILTQSGNQYDVLISSFNEVKEKLRKITGYKDSNELANQCQKEIDRLKEEKRIEEEKKIATNKKGEKLRELFTMVIVVIIIVFFIVAVVLRIKYNNATELMYSGQYEEAVAIFESLNGYKDSEAKIERCIIKNNYNNAVELMDRGEYEEAIIVFETLNGYLTSEDRIERCIQAMYNSAVELMDSGKYEEAINAFETLNGYKDCGDEIERCFQGLQTITQE